MREDQYNRMINLHERLTDVFLTESEPDKWPGAGIDPALYDQRTRGDRYWCKKNAVATIALMQRITSLTVQVQHASATGAEVVFDDDVNLDAEVAKAEKEAAQMLGELERIRQSSAKKAFDERVYGGKTQ